MENYKEKGYELVGITSQGLKVYKKIGKDESINVARLSSYHEEKFLGSTQIWVDIQGMLSLPYVDEVVVI